MQAQKMEAIGQRKGGLAHDFNNILNIVLGSLDLPEVEKPDNRELRDAALDAARRGSDSTRSLLAVARRTVLAVSDEGAGFDWPPFLEMQPERAFDLHGRGIAMSRLMSFDSIEYRRKGNVVERVSMMPENHAEAVVAERTAA